MTELEQGTSSNLDTSNSAAAPTQSSNTSAPSQVNETSAERTFRQSEVTDIVKRERQEAIERYRRLEVEQPEYFAKKYGESNRNVNTQQNSYDESHYRKIAAEEANRLRDQWMQEARGKHEEELARNTVNSFQQKMNAGKERYQDFDQVTGDIDYAAFPNVVQLLANFVDNSADVAYSLGNDLLKMEMLESLAVRSPQTAIKKIQQLSKSLTDNESAAKTRIPNAPLSQLRPSNTGVDNGARQEVRDYRRKYRG